jgi:hypothetical protein
MEHDPTPIYPEGEYGEIRLGESWKHVGSLLCFVAALGSKYLVQGIPRELLPIQRSWMPIPVTLLLTFVGITLGLAGLRHSQSAGLAKLGLFLNATTFGLACLAFLFFVYILPD